MVHSGGPRATITQLASRLTRLKMCCVIVTRGPPLCTTLVCTGTTILPAVYSGRLPHSYPCDDHMHTPHAKKMSRVQCSGRFIAAHFLRFLSSAARLAHQSGKNSTETFMPIMFVIFPEETRSLLYILIMCWCMDVVVTGGWKWSSDF